MKKIFSFTLIALTMLTSCDTLKNIPTNTGGSFFSLNGNWSLTSASDNALVGSAITVYPITGTGTVTTLANNTNCIREKDALWKDIKSGSNGTFSLNSLVSNCNNSILYRASTVTVLNNDQITLTVQNAAGTQITQTWSRIKK